MQSEPGGFSLQELRLHDCTTFGCSGVFCINRDGNVGVLRKRCSVRLRAGAAGDSERGKLPGSCIVAEPGAGSPCGPVAGLCLTADTMEKPTTPLAIVTARTIRTWESHRRG